VAHQLGEPAPQFVALTHVERRHVLVRTQDRERRRAVVHQRLALLLESLDDIACTGQPRERYAESLGERRQNHQLGTGDLVPPRRAAATAAVRRDRARPGPQDAERLRVIDDNTPGANSFMAEAEPVGSY
jgi:hypothetical protein